MKEHIVTLSKKLIAFKSDKESSDQMNAVVKFCKKELQDFSIEEFESNGIKSLLIYNTAKRPKKFKIILNGHIDIVQGNDAQFEAFEKDGKLYGRGSYDMKAATAVEIILFKELAASVKYPFGLQIVCDEEVGGFNGTKYQIDQGIRTEFAIVGEPTDFNIKNETKGIIWLRITAQGEASHGAYPWQGKNAIWKMNKFLNNLEQIYPEAKNDDWVTTVNLGKINSTNNSTNKVPDNCEVELDIRFIPADKDKVITKIREILPNDFKMEVLLDEPGQFTPTDNFYIKTLSDSIKSIDKSIKSKVTNSPGGSDIRHYTRVNNYGIEFGPIGAGHHTDEEWVDIQSLVDFYNILKNFLLKIDK